MPIERQRGLTLIQILALIALIGVVLIIVLPRWLDRGNTVDAAIEAVQDEPAAPESGN